MQRRSSFWALIATVSLCIAVGAAISEPGQRLEFGLRDAATSLLLHEIETDIVVVAIDSKSLRDVGQWPWPRRLHAQLIDRLAPAAPARVFVDIDFSVPSNPADDAELARTLRAWRGSPVLLPGFGQHQSATSAEVVLTEPLPALAESVEIASVNLQPDGDGLVRSVSSSLEIAGRTLPSVSAALNDLQLDSARQHWIDFTIDPASFTTVSSSDVLANNIPAQYFADKIVFIGATAIELGDVVPVPLHRALPGVIVQALAYESIRRGSFLELPAIASWPLLVLWTLALALLLRRSSWQRGSLTMFGALATIAGAFWLGFAFFGIAIAVVPLAVATLAVYILTTVRSLESESVRALMFAVGFRQRDALLKSVVQSSTDSIVCVDDSGRIRTANPASVDLFRWPHASLVGESLLRFVPELLRDPVDGARRSLDDLSNRVTEFSAVTDEGVTFPVELSVSRVRLERECLYTVIVRDVSERKAQHDQLRFQATHDALTALPNRPALSAHLDSVLQGGNARGPVALMMIDLNRFKEVNDTLGHNVGDYVLHDVARRLERLSRNRGFIARIGGDEFALVIDKDVSDTSIDQLSQSLVECLKEPVKTCGVSIDIGLSIGIAMYPKDAGDAEELFRLSDIAMYAAKRASTGYEYYDAANDLNSLRRLEIAARLRQAISAGELRLHYQPKVNLRSGAVDSVEALIRWTDPVLGQVRPDEFIALAETTDLVKPLSDWTMREAFRQATDWRRQGVSLRIAVNVSARLLQDARFPERIAALMAESDAAPENIELEITESAMMLDPARALKVVRKLNGLGVQISIDDYGTGYSSLAYLRDLPAHSLKLDKSFVNDLGRKEGQVIAASTVQMAHALNLEIVAEGVETDAEAMMLKDMGYDYAQGFLYSPAVAADDLLDWLRERRAVGDSLPAMRLS